MSYDHTSDHAPPALSSRLKTYVSPKTRHIVSFITTEITPSAQCIACNTPYCRNTLPTMQKKRIKMSSEFIRDQAPLTPSLRPDALGEPKTTP